MRRIGRNDRATSFTNFDRCRHWGRVLFTSSNGIMHGIPFKVTFEALQLNRAALPRLRRVLLRFARFLRTRADDSVDEVCKTLVLPRSRSFRTRERYPLAKDGPVHQQAIQPTAQTKGRSAKYGIPRAIVRKLARAPSGPSVYRKSDLQLMSLGCIIQRIPRPEIH